LAAAAADQLVNALGVWKYGLIPGIKTIDHLADDVIKDHLNILLKTLPVNPTGMDAAVLNSKGFGGNNASASILAPHIVSQMLTRKHGVQAMTKYTKMNDQVKARSDSYDLDCLRGQARPMYYFGSNVKAAEDVTLTANELKISGFANPINLDLENPYSDMC
jgi:acetoacetyl-[acyl-carrier protein] synthase